MAPDQFLDSAPIPHSGGTLFLFKVGDAYVIRLEGIFGDLMSTRVHGSEEKLAELACRGVGPEGRVLVGGLGMGFTLAATLRSVGPGVKVTVAELVPAVVRWNRERTGEKAGFPLRDSRVIVREGDVAEALDEGPWDAILLDVDNGPHGLTLPLNDRLYSAKGLGRASAALAEGGVLGVWSAGPDKGFSDRLRKAGFAVEERPVFAHGNRGPRHHLWLATRR